MTRVQGAIGRVGLAAVVATVAIALILIGYGVRTHVVAQELDVRIAGTEQEVSRLGYVLRLREQVRSLRESLLRDGVASLPEPLPGESGPAIVLDPSPPTPSWPSWPGRSHLAHQNRYLQDLEALVAIGRAAEGSIREFERRKDALQRLLQADRPADASSAPGPRGR